MRVYEKGEKVLVEVETGKNGKRGSFEVGFIDGIDEEENVMWVRFESGDYEMVELSLIRPFDEEVYNRDV